MRPAPKSNKVKVTSYQKKGKGKRVARTVAWREYYSIQPAIVHWQLMSTKKKKKDAQLIAIVYEDGRWYTLKSLRITKEGKEPTAQDAKLMAANEAIEQGLI